MTTAEKIPQALIDRANAARRPLLANALAALGEEPFKPSEMRALLSQSELADYTSALEGNASIQRTATDKPTALAHYESLLNRADFLFGQIDRLSYRKSKAAKVTGNEAESAYETAREHLESEMSKDASLVMWLDRPVRWDAGYEPGCDPESMPRLITSNSPHRQSRGLLDGIRPVIELQRDALQAALDGLEAKAATDEGQLPADAQRRLERVLQARSAR